MARKIKDQRCKNTFCSHRCSAIFSNKHRIREKKPKVKKDSNSRTIKVKLKIPCRGCGLEFQPTQNEKYCSNNCRSEAFSKAGRTSVQRQSETRRSLNEILFAELCRNRFAIETNKTIFNGWDADVIIDALKVAVLWNGKWHYSKIHSSQSLSQIQNRDKIKLN